MYPQYTVPILMYHYTGAGDGTLYVTTENFERQMKYLRDHRYHVISLDEFIQLKQQNAKFAHDTVVITFDDGKRDNYSEAFPVLKKYDMPVTIFVITQWVGHNAFLTWDQIREMSESGIDFGSHTQHHIYLPDVDAATIMAEALGSKKDLEKHLGKAARHFCYPSGGFTAEAKQLVRQAGYISALTTNRGYARLNKDLYELKRVKVTNSDTVKPFHFWGKLSGYYNLFRRSKSGH